MSSGSQTVHDKLVPASGGNGLGATLVAFVVGFLRAHFILLSVIALLVLIYALVGFFLVPRIARTQAQEFVTTRLGKRLELGEIRFNPFALDTSISGMRLTEPDGALLVAFRHLYVNATIASIWQRGVVLESVDLSAPDIQLVVARDGSVNLANLVPPGETPKTQNEPLPRVRIGQLTVREGRLGVEDRTRPRVFTAAAKPIRFALSNFRTDVDFRNDYRFAGVTARGEELEWSGGFTVQPLGSSGQFRLKGLKLTTIDAYLYPSLPFRLTDGQALLSGSYNFALDPLALDVTLPSVAIHNLAMRDHESVVANATTLAAVRVPEVDLQQITFSLQQRALTLKRVDVRGAAVDVVREPDGSVSLARLLEGPASSATGAPAAPSGQPAPATDESPDWNLKVETIRLEQAEVHAEDRSVTPAAKFDLAPANLTIDGWTNAPGAGVHIDVDVGINGGGRFAAQGDVKLEPVSAVLKLDTSALDLTALQPYISQATSLQLHSGSLSSKGELTFATVPEAAPPLKFSGDVEVTNLRTTDPTNQDFIKWRSLAVSGISYELHPERLTIERILARQPYASVIIAQDTTLNISRVLQRPGEPTEITEDPPKTAPAAGTAESKPLSARIRTVDIVDGSANFADYSIEPSFATGILGLNGRITGLSSVPASRAKVQLAGKVDKYAPVDINGEVNLLAAAKYTDLAMNFRNMELTTFNPYSGKFAGYSISRGKLSTELKYKVEDRKLDAAHHIVLDNLEFGAKTDSKDAAPIPIKLAVALLKDRNGVIDVNLPVSGTLDDPKFRLGPIIWKAFLGLLTKIVTAPFAALGALFGGGDEMAFVDFAPGSAELPAAQMDKLTNLSRALVERPQLKLNVPLTAVGAEDGDALAHAALAAKLPPNLPTDTADEAAAGERLKALEALYQSTLKAPPAYPTPAEGETPTPAARIAWLEEALLAQFQPDATALDALARQRARAVQDALLANMELDPERVFITNEVSGTRSEAGTVRMEMKLE